MKPIGLQLYSLREFAKTKEDFANVVRRVADIGYKVVEPAGLHDFAPGCGRGIALGRGPARNGWDVRPA